MVTLLLLHLGMDTQLLPGAQHTHSGPGGGDGWGGPRIRGRGPQCCPAAGATWAAPGAQGSLAHTPGQPEGVAGAEIRPRLERGEGLSPWHGPALSQHPGRGRETGAGLRETLPPASSLSWEAGGEGTPTLLQQRWGLQHGAGPPPHSCPDPRPQLTPRWLRGAQGMSLRSGRQPHSQSMARPQGGVQAEHPRDPKAGVDAA